MSTQRLHCDVGAKRCRECHNAQARASYAKNIEKNRERMRRRVLDNPEPIRKSKREHEARKRAADPAAANAKCRAAYQALSPEKKALRVAAAHRWTKAHPLAKQIDRLNYARRKMNAPGRFTPADLAAQFNAQGGLCFYCVTPLASMQIEHIVPLSRGGSNWPENIACACSDCNLRKGAKSAAEFFEVIRGEQVANDRKAA